MSRMASGARISPVVPLIAVLRPLKNVCGQLKVKPAFAIRTSKTSHLLRLGAAGRGELGKAAGPAETVITRVLAAFHVGWSLLSRSIFGTNLNNGESKPSEVGMPRYYFVAEMPDHTYDDSEGAQLPSDAAAKDYGVRAVRELKERGFEAAGAVLHVRDEDGQTIQSIPF